jgi:hypothetical protein
MGFYEFDTFVHDFFKKVMPFRKYGLLIRLYGSVFYVEIGAKKRQTAILMEILKNG